MANRQILDHRGEPIRPSKRKDLRAKFDLAQTTRDNEKHWANADGRSARSALAPAVRKRLRDRSRYEAENSSWYAGILSTATNHIVGTGPRLQSLTANAEGNQRIERAWSRWCKASGFTTKLRVLFETYWREGECFGLRSSRPSLYPIDLDLRTYEAEQVQSPYDSQTIGDPFVDDGIRFIPASETIEYFFLDHHPSDPFFTPSWKGDWRPACDVIHLFRPTRCNQLRGIPRAAPGLPLLAVMRRFEIATVHAAEVAANQPMVLETTSGANIQPAQSPEDFATIELERNMATIIPEGWRLGQAKPEHPATTMEMFIRQLLMHFCRSMNVPFGLAAGTSKDSNFSSHKGDIRNLWQPEVRAEQELLEREVVNKVFRWFLEGALLSGLLDDMPPIDQIDYQWYWDGIPPLDETDAATATQIRTTSGQSTLPQEYAANGQDFETVMAKGDATFGLPPGTYKRAVFQSMFPAFQAAPQSTPAGVQAAAETAVAAPAGEYTDLGQRSFNNQQKRIETTVSRLSTGEISEPIARVTLETIGLDPSRIDRLIEIAMDGVITQQEMAEVQS